MVGGGDVFRTLLSYFLFFSCYCYWLLDTCSPGLKNNYDNNDDDDEYAKYLILE